MCDLLLLANFRNEFKNVGWFFRHYREIGVTEFHIVDNGSTDGTKEFLEKEPDVKLYDRSDASFRAAKFGVNWLNEIRSKVGKNKWCLFVDADEMFVYPGYPDLPLTKLTIKLERLGQRCLIAPMIDMFNAQSTFLKTHEESSLPEKIYPNYMPAYIRFFSSDQYPYMGVRGGAREYFFGKSLLEVSKQRSTNLRKIPLIFCEDGNEYLTVHTTKILPPSDLTGALLHFKINGYLPNHAKEEVSRREHFEGAIEYRAYDSAFSIGFPTNTSTTHISSWSGVGQLYREGIVSCPENWLKYIEKKGCNISTYNKNEQDNLSPLCLWPSIAELVKKNMSIF